MNQRILVTGATGNVGSEVARGLQQDGHAVRIAAHDTVQARTLFGPKADVVRFDFLDSSTFGDTFAGVDRLFLVRPPALANVERDIAPAVHAAVAAGVQHIVFLSIQGVEKNRVVPHYKIEQLILQTGVDYTFLRAGFFMQNLSTTHSAEIRKHGEIALPVGAAKTSFIDVRDIAAVAACALIENEHRNKVYTLTGAEALDYSAVAARLSSILDRPVRYTRPSVLGYVRCHLAQGEHLGYVLVTAGLYTLTRFGNAASVTDDVRQILNRPPISFDQFARDYRSCWTSTDTMTGAL